MGGVRLQTNTMSVVKVIPDNQRVAVLRDGRECRVVGPGVIVAIRWPGRRYVPVSIGDRGRLVSAKQAQFGKVLLPVELRRSSTSTAVRVAGFHDNAIVVEPEDSTSPSTISTQESGSRESVRYTALGFWIGLPFVLLLAVVSWAGVWYAADQIHTERVVYERGTLTTGTVVQKIRYRQTRSWEQTTYITYEFRTSDGATVRNEEIRVKPAFWHALKENGPIAVRYVPNEAALNLPDGWHMSSFYYVAGGVALVGALLFSVVTVGMLIKKFSGGYRGETHPFLGGRPPRQRS